MFYFLSIISLFSLVVSFLEVLKALFSQIIDNVMAFRSTGTNLSSSA